MSDLGSHMIDLADWITNDIDSAAAGIAGGLWYERTWGKRVFLANF